MENSGFYVTATTFSASGITAIGVVFVIVAREKGGITSPHNKFMGSVRYYLVFFQTGNISLDFQNSFFFHCR